MPLQPPIFTRKTYGAKLYKWAPVKNEKVKTGEIDLPYYCDATQGSQGQDWITTYVYDQVLVNGNLARYAYVACDYVV